MAIIRHTHNYNIRHDCSTLTRNGVQGNEPATSLEIDLYVINTRRWGFPDSLRRIVIAFPGTLPFETSETKFSYFAKDTWATNPMADHGKDDLQRCGLCQHGAVSLAAILRDICDDQIANYKDVTRCHMAIFVELESVFAHEDYLTNRAIRESSEGELRLCPAPESAIEALGKAAAVANDNSKCTVCTEEFVKGEEVTRMPCNHVFHSNCIVSWLKNMNTCPNCRAQL